MNLHSCARFPRLWCAGLLGGLLAFGPVARATTYYVAKSGNDTNAGTQQAPFLTVQRGASAAQPGDVVVVGDGEYREWVAPNSGRPGAPVTLQAEHKWAARIVSPDFHAAFHLWGERYETAPNESWPAGVRYVVIDGFDCQSTTDKQDSNGIVGRWAHHVTVRNCRVHDSPLHGIGFSRSDYLTVEDNVVYGNSRRSTWAGSGITLGGTQPYDQGAGWHKIIQRNRCYNNGAARDAGVNSDGHGISLDIDPLGVATLIANNICYNNGGGGIWLNNAHNVWVVNNTCYKNGWTAATSSDWGVEMSVNDVTWDDPEWGNSGKGPSTNVVIRNNIFVARGDLIPHGLTLSVAPTSVNCTVSHNLVWNATPGHTTNLPGGGPNAVVADPRFVDAPPALMRAAGQAFSYDTAPNPEAGDFRLQAGSPARDAGTAANAPATDIAGTARPQGAGYDLGAFEFSGPDTPTPGFGGVYRLLARHSGKALDVAGASTVDGAGVQQWADGGGANQRWKIEPTSGGYYKLTAQHSGKCLDVSGVSTADGALVHQWEYVGEANQQWAIEPTDGGYYKLTARHSGKALDVDGGPTATGDGTRVQQWAYVGGANQQWKIEAVATARLGSPVRTVGANASVSLSLYPNPAEAGELQVSGAEPGAEVRLLDLNGHEKLRTRADAAGRARLLRPAELPAGLYLVRCARQSLRLALE